MTALEGTTVVITGACPGIGRGAALLAAEAGAHVVVADTTHEQDTLGRTEEVGGSASAHDVREVGPGSRS